ncbi:MAG TPA: hypothetical protein VHQ64_09850 [Pyrinomonadaceae bacterium]|nr:hypothetical protein [Pyrinomonadaceae bacterium]
MADSWGKVYVFNATMQDIKAYFNDPSVFLYTLLRYRRSPPYEASNVAVPRGSQGDKPGTFWNSTQVRFQGDDWDASYAIQVPNTNDQNTPVSDADDLLLYVFRDWIILCDTRGFTLRAIEYNPES